MRSRPCSPPKSCAREGLPNCGDSEGRPTPRCGLVGSISATVIGEDVGTIQPWPADEELVIESPPAHDPDFKRSALASPMGPDFNFETAGATPTPGNTMAAPPEAFATGEMVAVKGEVTGPGKRPKTPAERLSLDDKQRAKSEKCLAEAVYFESRGE